MAQNPSRKKWGKAEVPSRQKIEMADDDFERQASPGKKHEDEDDYSDDDFLDPA